MNENFIEEGQEKVELLRNCDSVNKGTVCRVVAMRQDEREQIRVDIESSTGLKFENLLIGEDCEFTEAPMNYPGGYQRMLIHAPWPYGKQE